MSAVGTGLAEQGHREHGRRVVEPGLAFQDPGQLRRQRELTQHREHRRRIGRGQDRAQQQRIAPGETRQQPDHRRQDQHADRHPDGSQQHRGRAPQPGPALCSWSGRPRPGSAPARAGPGPPPARHRQTAPPARTPQRQAKTKEDQQRREPGRMRQPGRHDRGDHHAGRGQQHETEVTRRHRRLSIAAPRSGAALAISLPDQRPPAGRPRTSQARALIITS